jgi:hypothetical protein
MAGSVRKLAHGPCGISEARAAGLEIVDLVGIEGIAFALSDLEERLASEEGRSVVFDAARTIERVPELMGSARTCS